MVVSIRMVKNRPLGSCSFYFPGLVKFPVFIDDLFIFQCLHITVNLALRIVPGR